MGLIEKLETLINKLLLLLGDRFTRLMLKLIPEKVRTFYTKILNWIIFAIAWCKAFPSLVKNLIPVLINRIKSHFAAINFKDKFQETYKAAITQYQKSHKSNQLSGFKTLILTPFLLVGQWVKGLSSVQTILLLGFTSASILSILNIVSTGNKIIDQHFSESRSPASIETEVAYDRPDYYKKQSRYFEIVNLKLPVYVSKVNELRTIDIDFTATMSNRMSRMQLEKLEFQLRDHLVLNVEPMIASFPLEEEGKIIIREKLTTEIESFMTAHKISGDVLEIKLIYILAN